MDRQEIAQQTQVEQEMLGHIMHVLRTATTWPVHNADASRKLSTLRFVGQSFERHLERLLVLEENDGFLDLVRRIAPWMGRKTDALQAQHAGFRTQSHQLVGRLEALGPSDVPALDAVCGDLLRLLARIEEHNGKEVGLLQEALARDEGGEG
jgi:hypothetical protein